MHAVKEALRERRIAAESLANACLPHVKPSATVPMKLAYHLDPILTDEQTALLIKLG